MNARVSSGFQTGENNWNHEAPGRVVCSFRAFGNLMKLEAWIFWITFLKNQYKIMQCCIFPIFLMPCMRNLLYSVGIHCICEILFLIIQ